MYLESREGGASKFWSAKLDGRKLHVRCRHWLATGCFRSHDFDAVWSLAEPHVPVKVAPKKNLWLRYYDAQFKTQYAR